MVVPGQARPRAAGHSQNNVVTFWDDTEHENPHHDGANAAPGADLAPPGAANGDTTRIDAGWPKPNPRKRSSRRAANASRRRRCDRLSTVPTADRGDPGTHAVAFTTELLDTDFAVRRGLRCWPGPSTKRPPTPCPVPASVAGKALVLSLADPDLPGRIPLASALSGPLVADAQAGVSQSVADVQAEVDPDRCRTSRDGNPATR